MKTAKAHRLTNRARRILAMMHQYGLVTPEAVRKREYPTQSVAAAVSAMSRLREAGLAASRPLYGKYVCYQLTPKACRLLQVPSRASRPLGRQALIERYAVLSFCAVEPERERILFNPGCESAFSVDPQKLRRVHFYIDQDRAEPLMGLITIDQGAPPFRLAAKAARRIGRYLAHGWISQAVLAGAVELAFLVCSPPKAALLEHALPKHLFDPLTLPLQALFGRAPPSTPCSAGTSLTARCSTAVPAPNSRSAARSPCAKSSARASPRTTSSNTAACPTASSPASTTAPASRSTGASCRSGPTSPSRAPSTSASPRRRGPPRTAPPSLSPPTGRPTPPNSAPRRRTPHPPPRRRWTPPSPKSSAAEKRVAQTRHTRLLEPVIEVDA